MRCCELSFSPVPNTVKPYTATAPETMYSNSLSLSGSSHWHGPPREHRREEVPIPEGGRLRHPLGESLELGGGAHVEIMACPWQGAVSHVYV